jgi:hypothetical protein
VVKSNAQKFNSQGWFQGVRALAAEFYTASDKSLVTYNEKTIDKIERDYPARLRALKEEIFDKGDLARSRIDRHKIIALYIQFFLEEPLFKVPRIAVSDKGSVLKIKLMNELFCIAFIRRILITWNGKDFNYDKFKKEYALSFSRILYRYKEHAEFYKKNTFFTYALAHVIYFIERDFLEERNYD